MPRFLFRFGYNFPAQLDANAAHGWDDEDSAACFIDAPTRDEALVFGCEVAERMVDRLFAADGHAPFSWKAGRYAFWIEDDPAAVMEMELMESAPTVAIGEMPDFSRWMPGPG